MAKNSNSSSSGMDIITIPYIRVIGPRPFPFLRKENGFISFYGRFEGNFISISGTEYTQYTISYKSELYTLNVFSDNICSVYRYKAK